jgi:H+/Cl- antiporter ClcA
VPLGWAATGQAIFVGQGDRMLGWARSSTGLPSTAALVVGATLVLALVAADLVGGLLVPLLSLGGMIGLVLTHAFLPGTPLSFAVVAGGCALLAVVHRTPATAVAVAVAAFGWSTATWVTAGTVLLAVAASGPPRERRPALPRGQRVRS